MSSTLFRNCRLYTPVDKGIPASGPEQGRLASEERGALLVSDGVIAAAGNEKTVSEFFPADETVDLGGRCVVPGFVDPHTHLCFAARRENEFRMRLNGSTYLEILGKGGGILSSVRAVHDASDDELFDATLANALNALRHGTTTLK